MSCFDFCGCDLSFDCDCDVKSKCRGIRSVRGEQEGHREKMGKNSILKFYEEATMLTLICRYESWTVQEKNQSS